MLVVGLREVKTRLAKLESWCRLASLIPTEWHGLDAIGAPNPTSFRIPRPQAHSRALQDLYREMLASSVHLAKLCGT